MWFSGSRNCGGRGRKLGCGWIWDTIWETPAITFIDDRAHSATSATCARTGGGAAKNERARRLSKGIVAMRRIHRAFPQFSNTPYRFDAAPNAVNDWDADRAPRRGAALRYCAARFCWGIVYSTNTSHQRNTGPIYGLRWVGFQPSVRKVLETSNAAARSLPPSASGVAQTRMRRISARLFLRPRSWRRTDLTHIAMCASGTAPRRWRKMRDTLRQRRRASLGGQPAAQNERARPLRLRLLGVQAARVRSGDRYFHGEPRLYHQSNAKRQRCSSPW